MVQEVMEFAEGTHWKLLFLEFNLKAAKSIPDVHLEPHDDFLADPVKRLHVYHH